MKTTLFLTSAALIAGSSLSQAIWLTPPPAQRTVVQTTTHYSQPAYQAPPARGYRQMATDEMGFYTEGAAFFGFSSGDALEDIPEFDSMDIVGFDFSVGHRFNRFHAVNLRIGYGYGYGDAGFYYRNGDTTYMDMSMSTFTLMPGYRFSFGPRNSPLEFFAGVNAGLSVVGAYLDQEDYSRGSRFGDYYEFDGTEAGFAFSAEVGVKYHYSPRGYIFASYEFRGSTASPKVEWDVDSSFNYDTKAQFYHTIRFGGGIEF